jgi:uncharacterized membrane protein
MNQPIVYAVIAMGCYGISDFIYKRVAAAGIRSDHFIMAQAWLFCPVVILYAAATQGFVFDPPAIWGLLAGIVSFIGFYNFSRSLTVSAVSINASLFRMNFIVTVFLVIVFLGEPLTTSKLVGLALASLATWLLVGARGDAHPPPRAARRRSLIQVALATLTFGASNFFHTVGLRHGAIPEQLVVAQAITFMPLATAVVYATDRGVRPPLATFKYSVAAALLLLSATILLLRAVAAGQASVLVPIAQMGFIVAALLGIVVLHEPITTRKVIGLGLALSALAALVGS